LFVCGAWLDRVAMTADSPITPAAKRPRTSPQITPPDLDGLHQALAGRDAGPLMHLLAGYNMPLLFQEWERCSASPTATEHALYLNFPACDTQPLQDAQVLSPVHGLPPGQSAVTSEAGASACVPGPPSPMLVQPQPLSPIPVPEYGLPVACKPTAMRSDPAATLAAMTATVPDHVASTPVLVTLQPVPPIPMPVLQPVPAAPAALDCEATSGLVHLPPVHHAAVQSAPDDGASLVLGQLQAPVHPAPGQLQPAAVTILPSAHGPPTKLGPAPAASAMSDTSATQLNDAATLDYVHRPGHQAPPANIGVPGGDVPVACMSNRIAGFGLHNPEPAFHAGAFQHLSNPMTAAAMSAGPEPTAPHHAPHQLSGHHAAPTAAADFLTPTRELSQA